jgi:hypothetical protein
MAIATPLHYHWQAFTQIKPPALLNYRIRNAYGHGHWSGKDEARVFIGMMLAIGEEYE